MFTLFHEALQAVNHSTCMFIQGGELSALFCNSALCKTDVVHVANSVSAN